MTHGFYDRFNLGTEMRITKKDNAMTSEILKTISTSAAPFTGPLTPKLTYLKVCRGHFL